MFKTAVDFKIGQLNTLEEQLFEITEENQHLEFSITGKKNNDSYSLNFITFINLEEMLKFKLNEHINFIQYVDDGDIVFGKNGIYDTNTEIKMDIMRYLSNHFILVIEFKGHDNIVGYLELSFSVKNSK